MTDAEKMTEVNRLLDDLELLREAFKELARCWPDGDAISPDWDV